MRNVNTGKKEINKPLLFADVIVYPKQKKISKIQDKKLFELTRVQEIEIDSIY